MTDEASGLTNKLSKLTVVTHSSKHTVSSKPTSIPKPVAKDTPVSPDKGTAVFPSYKLRRHTMETEDPKTTETSQNTTEPENMANEVRHLNVPTGNATRPPPPDKYKKWKFQIDKVRYYSCMYCNKHLILFTTLTIITYAITLQYPVTFATRSTTHPIPSSDIHTNTWTACTNVTSVWKVFISKANWSHTR